MLFRPPAGKGQFPGRPPDTLNPYVLHPHLWQPTVEVDEAVEAQRYGNEDWGCQQLLTRESSQSEFQVTTTTFFPSCEEECEVLGCFNPISPGKNRQNICHQNPPHLSPSKAQKFITKNFGDCFCATVPKKNPNCKLSLKGVKI